VAEIDAEGYRELDDSVVAGLIEDTVETRRTR
jgi:hypothetical protein